MRSNGRVRLAPVAEGGYLLFVWKPTGYELAEREGEAPSAGDEVEIDGSFVVIKVAASPLPGDDRPCAYLQEV